MAENNEGFTFADFNFAQPQSLPINGAQEDDNDWGDFFVASSHPSNSKPYSNFDPFTFRSDPYPIMADPAPTSSGKRSGAMPLSFEPDLNSGSWFDPNCPAQNGKIEVKVGSNGDAFGDLNTHSQKIKPDIRSGLNSGVSVSDMGNLDEGDDDEWEFTGAVSTNNGRATEYKEELWASVSSKFEPAAVESQEKQAGQDVSSSAEHKHGSKNSVPQFVDLFAAYHELFHKPSETNAGLNISCTTPTANGFMPNMFHGIDASVNGTGTSAISVDERDDFDDFGNFIDASQEAGPQRKCIPDNTVVPNGNIHEGHQLQREFSRGPLPMSLFSDDLDERSDDLTHQDEMFDKPISNPRNGVSIQGVGMSMNDLLSNLYSQPPSLDSNTKPAENGVQPPENPEAYVDDDEWDDNSWEFKDAFSETGINEESPYASMGTLSHKLSNTTSNLQFYMDFYAKLRGCLCILLSHELNEEKKFQSSDTGNDEKTEFSHDIQESYKLLEGNVTTEDYQSRKHLDKNCCLNEVFESLQEPKCKVIESVYSLSERLELAMNDWRAATELLKHVISVLHTLSLGSAEEQSAYVAIWSKIVGVCAQELKHGALLWKRALAMNVQAQVLSNLQGQLYIRALGEIYKIVELLRLSTKLYKPWMFFSESDPQYHFGPFEECASLWSSSGLEEALLNISDDIDLGNKEAAKTLMVSIKNLHDVDVLAMHDSVFVQRQPICQLSLLPQAMLSDWKVAVWNQVPYFVKLANLWANLISRDPPQLPLLQVT